MASGRTGTPIPERMESLERDERDLPIPFIVQRDPTGKPLFTINDVNTVLKCLSQGLCSICGGELPDDDIWLLGGEKSAFDPRGCYLDPPVHGECGRYALQVCPHLAAPKYKEFTREERINRLSKMDLSNTVGLIDQTRDPARPETFVMVRVNGLVLDGLPPNGLIHPNKPYLEAEIWRHGERLEALGRSGAKLKARPYEKKATREDGFHISLLPQHRQQLAAGRMKGVTPWKKG